MKTIVCMKQVPATTKVEIDEEIGTLKRTSADSRTNPFDLFALECALRIREQRGGTVTVLTMGPQQAESMIRDAIRSFTAPERVWVGEEIAREFYPDEMPEYGVFPPELYVEVLCRDEVAAIMKYAYENNIPVVARGAGTGLAGGANCKYGGIMLSLMKMNRIDPVDTQNMTVTCQPGALITEVAAAASAAGLFYPPIRAKRRPRSAVRSSRMRAACAPCATASPVPSTRSSAAWTRVSASRAI